MNKQAPNVVSAKCEKMAEKGDNFASRRTRPAHARQSENGKIIIKLNGEIIVSTSEVPVDVAN